MKAWGYLAAAIVAEVTGSLSLKAALERPVLYVLVAVAYVVAFALLGSALRTIPLGVAYGIWGAVGVALTAFMSFVLFDEPLTPLMVAGMAVLIAGVLCVELGSQRERRTAAEVA